MVGDGSAFEALLWHCGLESCLMRLELVVSDVLLAFLATPCALDGHIAEVLEVFLLLFCGTDRRISYAMSARAIQHSLADLLVWSSANVNFSNIIPVAVLVSIPSRLCTYLPTIRAAAVSMV